MAYVHCMICDLRNLVHHTWTLAALNEFYGPRGAEVWIGRDPRCDIIIDDPEVLPRHARLTAASNHRMAYIDGKYFRHDGKRAFALGPYGVLIYEGQPHSFGPPPMLPVRFGRQFPPIPGVAPVPAPGNDTELRRIFLGLRDPERHIHELDDAAQAFCEARLREHCERLGVALGRVEYTSSFAYARARSQAEWNAAETRFVPTNYGYVRAFDAWSRAFGYQESPPFLALAIGRLWPDPQLVDKITRNITIELGAEPDSAIRPLIALAERGAFAFALPENAMLVLLPSCKPTQRCSDHGEGRFIEALANDPSDHATRGVYADLLEQRGHHTRAEWLRAEARGATAAPTVPRVETMFSYAATVLLDRAYPLPEIPPPTPEQPPRPARLDGAQSYVLGARTGFRIDNKAFAVAQVEPHFTITYAGGTYWLREHTYSGARVNAASCSRDTNWPLVDGDTVELGYAHSFTFRT